MSALVELEGVDVRRGRREVVHDVSLTVDEGEVVAVLGPNGAGKSTLLEAIGSVITAGGTVRRHGRVATVLQTPGLARRSVVANVDLAQAWWGVPRRERRARSLSALAGLRAEHLARRYAEALSGGERRRVHLARGLAVRADVLLLDEPFAGLDAESHAALLDDSATALRTSSRATVLVVHDRVDAWALADRVVVLLDGRVAADGTPEELLEHPPSAQVARFLGYDGSLRSGGQLRLTRARHVLVRAGDGPGDGDTGEADATVLRVVRREDGARVQLGLASGTVWGEVDRTGAEPVRLREGDAVRVRITGGATFADDAGAAARAPRGTT